MDERGRNLNLLKGSLMGAGVALLGVGVLWNTHWIDPLRLQNPVKLIAKNGVSSSVTKIVPNRAVQEKPKSIATMPEVTGFNSPALKGAWAEIDSPASPADPDEVEQGATSFPQLMAGELAAPSHLWKDQAQSDQPVPPLGLLSYPYSIQLSACRTLESAKIVISTNRQKGLSPYWVKMHFREKGIWYRVFVGHFEDREQTERFREEHGLKGSEVKRTRYANLIAVLSRRDEVERQVASLEKLGYSPYVINGEDGEFRLFVGAFLAQEDAERQREDLRANGVHNELVLR